MHNDMANRTKNQDRLNFAGDYSIDSAEIISYQIGDGGPGVGSEPVRMDIKNIMVCPTNRIFNLYCYRVSGAVGLISLSIFGEYNKNGKSFALYLAKALQITNILRDINED